MRLVAMGAPNFGANAVSKRPIVDTRPFLGSSDFWLLGIATALTVVLFYSVTARKTRPYFKKRRRAARRKAYAYHTAELRRLKRSGYRARKRLERAGRRGPAALSESTLIKIGKGQAVPFSSLPPGLQKQIRRSA